MSNSVLALDPIAVAPFPLWVRLCGPFLLKPEDDPDYFDNNRGWLPANQPHIAALAEYLYEHEKAGGNVFVFDPLLVESQLKKETAQDLMYQFGLNAWVVDRAEPPPHVEVIDQWPLPTKTTSPQGSTASPTTT